MKIQIFLVLHFSAFVFSSGTPSLGNVTVHCHNFENIVYWNYSHPNLSPRFLVAVNGYVRGPSVVEECSYVKEYRCNISSVTMDVGDHYFVNVTALAGSSVVFNYSMDFTYSTLFDGHSCTVDFPRVNTSTKEDHFVLEFPHPLAAYKTLNGIRNEDDYSMLTVKVSCEDGVHMHSCHIEEDEICKVSFSLGDEKKVNCCSVEGNMNGVVLRSANEACWNVTMTRELKMMYLVLICVCSFVGSVMLLSFVVLVYKKITDGSANLPKVMASVISRPGQCRDTMRPEKESTSVVRSMDSLSATDKLLESDSSGSSTPADTLLQDCSRFPIPCIDGDPSAKVSEEEERAESETSPPVSFGYDRPKFPNEQSSKVEMGPGDTVDGYRD